MLKKIFISAFLSIFVASPAIATNCKIPPNDTGSYWVFMRSKDPDPICRSGGRPVYTSLEGNFSEYVQHSFWGEWRRVYIFSTGDDLKIEYFQGGYGAYLIIK